MKTNSAKHFIMYLVLKGKSYGHFYNYKESKEALRIASLLSLNSLMLPSFSTELSDCLLFSLPNKTIADLTGSWKNPACCWKTQ